MSWESPIDVIYKQQVEELEGNIVRGVLSYDINVNKEELLKALQYDRQQYEKGYADAKAEALTEESKIVRCMDCAHYKTHGHRCGFFNHGVSRVDYCSYGRRRQDEAD